MKLQTEENIIRGIPICRGIAIGKPFLLTFVEGAPPEYSISEEQVEKEVQRYRRALQLSIQDVKSLQKQLEREKALEGVAILEAYLEIMKDPLMTTDIEAGIQKHKKNVEYVFHIFVEHYQRKFSTLADSFFRERFKDIRDISRRIMGHLREQRRPSLADISEAAVVFAKELAVSDVAAARSECVKAFVTEMGGTTSHAAIVSKAKGIPYVANVDLDKIERAAEADVIVDGRTGEVILSPSEETLAKYQRLQEQVSLHFQNLEKNRELEAETYDGYQVRLSANIEMLNELDMLHQYGGRGVGLFRSEYIFLNKDSFPTEEEQFVIYQHIVEKMEGLPVVIRAFDVGGDKFTMRLGYPQEGNPFLGCRAIRFLLKEREIFNTQLRAILRASAYGDVSIMFPMVSGLAELLEAKAMVRQARAQLEKEGKKVSDAVRIGCMIEVPSAAIIADLLAKECDFLSIGTNDLVQYSLAVDRGNQVMSPLYTPTHPSVIRLIKLIVSEANHHGIPVTVCGEIAADPRFTPLLLGLGVHELSVSSRYIPIVKNAIRSTSIVEATQLAEKTLSLASPTEIQELLTLEYQKTVPNDFVFNL